MISLINKGVDFKIKPYQFSDFVANYIIFDIMLEHHRKLNPSYMRNLDGLIFMYSCNDYNSFESVKDFLDQSIKLLEKGRPICMILVGTKCDLVDERKVDRDEAKSFADAHGMKFFEVSAKTNINIQESFNYMKEKIECFKKIRIEEDVKREVETKKTQGFVITSDMINRPR